MSRPPPSSPLKSLGPALITSASAHLMNPPPNKGRSDSLPCNYSSHVCHGERLAGQEFCARHMVKSGDRTATPAPPPYRFCSYTGLDGGRCALPAARSNRLDSLCLEHTRLIQAARLSKKRTAPYTVFLEYLKDYKKIKVESGTSGSTVDPLKPKPEEEGLGQLTLQLADRRQDPDQNDNDEEEEEWVVGDTWVGDGDSDCDSVDSEAEDLLQHAGTYTAEEVVRTMRDKLIRLQKLYIDQFQRLLIKMRESRRLYLQQVRQEREAGLVSIFDQTREEVGYAKLKALVHYHNPVGREALLAKRHREKRAAATPGYRPPQLGPCQHALTSSTKCGAATVPMAKFCLKHILEEPGQILYRACGVVTASDAPCETPVASLYPNTACVFHTKLLSPAVSPVKVTPAAPDVKDADNAVKVVTIKHEEDVKDEPKEIPSGDVVGQESQIQDEEHIVDERMIKASDQITPVVGASAEGSREQDSTTVTTAAAEKLPVDTEATADNTAAFAAIELSRRSEAAALVTPSGGQSAIVAHGCGVEDESNKLAETVTAGKTTSDDSALTAAEEAVVAREAAATAALAAGKASATTDSPVSSLNATSQAAASAKECEALAATVETPAAAGRSSDLTAVTSEKKSDAAAPKADDPTI